MSETSSLQYPIQLSADDILGFLPHRPPMLFIRQATVLAADSFEGTAHWAADNPILAGHFPGCPIVPGAIILEAAAQLAGIGLLAGDPVTRNIEPGHVGMLGAVRKCSFKTPRVARRRPAHHPNLPPHGRKSSARQRHGRRGRRRSGCAGVYGGVRTRKQPARIHFTRVTRQTVSQISASAAQFERQTRFLIKSDKQYPCGFQAIYALQPA